MYLEEFKLTVFVLFVGLFLIIFLSAIQVVVAKEIDSIIFTEIMYDFEGGDDGYEWVEIYNNSTDNIIINENWRFYDGSNHLVNIVQGDDVFEVGEVLLVADNAVNFIEKYPDYLGTILDSVVKLNNTGEIIKLSIDAGENWIISVEYLNSMNNSGEGYSLVFDMGNYISSSEVGGNPGLYNFVENNSECCDCNTCSQVETIEDEVSGEIVEEEIEENVNDENVGGTQDDQLEEIVEIITEEDEPTLPVYSNKIRINELLPDPDGSDEENEFIELFNADDKQIDLKDWYLQDLSGQKYVLSKSIELNNYVLLDRTETKITLNNASGDTIKLFNPNNDLVSSISYDKSINSQSYSYFVDEWKWVKDITPGSENIFVEEIVEQEVVENDEEEEIVPSEIKTELELKLISDIKQLDKNTEVYTQGIVTVEPGRLAETYFYMSEVDFVGNINLSTGIQVYFSKKDFINLSIGDIIVVMGTLSEVSGEKRIKISSKDDIEIIDSTSLPEPEELLTGEVCDDYEGALVYVSGDLVDKQSSSWYLDDDSGEIRIYINSSTGIEKPLVELGQEVLVVGIISETKSGFRILPRFNEDISAEKIILGETEPEINVIVKPKDKYMDVEEKDNTDKNDYLGYGLGVVGLTMASWVLKLKLL